MTRHADQTGAHLHVASRTVADNAARLVAEAALIAADIGMQIEQVDNGSLWYCTAAATLTPFAVIDNIVCFEDAVVCFEDQVVTI